METRHRQKIGGMWETIGQLQFDYLINRGLKPHHRLVDIGCGSLRGGIHFIAYLDPGCYFGIDRNERLIAAGLEHELTPQLREAKQPIFLVRDDFELARFTVEFDFAIAQSVFTHLPLNSILRCLVNVEQTLAPEGMFFATFFESTLPLNRLDPIEHHPGGVVTFPDADPYHYDFETLAWAAERSGLDASYIGAWDHPRDQRLASFVLRRS